MNSYLVKRLSPIYIFYIGIELLELAVMFVLNRVDADLSFSSIVKTVGILILTSSVSFLYMMIPYVLYLLLLPRNKYGSNLDKIITTIYYTFLVYLVIFEEVASLVFWDEFYSAFNFIAVDYLIYTTEVVKNIQQSYPVAKWLLGIMAATFVIVLFSYRYLTAHTDIPKFPRRLFCTSIYILFGVLMYFNVDIANLEVGSNRVNNELAKEGAYSLFSAFFKNELPYNEFYITHDEKQNLNILRNELSGDNVKFLSDDGIARYISSNNLEKKANVVVVLMESMSAEFIGKTSKYQDTPLTPNLSILANEGIYFSHVYANGTRSVRGIEAVMLSVPPLPGQSIVRRPKNENLHNLGSIFAAKGYQNKWIYGGYGYFDNMNYFFSNNGFEVVDLPKWQKGEASFVNAWGASDENSYNKVIQEADKSYAEGKPFFTVILSISNHRPFTYPEGKIDLEQKVTKRDGGVKYADYAIGEFVKAAKQKPWFDNTIFVFVADHTAGAAGSEELVLAEHHIPLIFYAPKMLQPKKVDFPISQIDVAPTLLGLLNFDYESRFYGKDIFNSNYQPRFFISNYQKIGYNENDRTIILKPIKQKSYLKEDKDDGSLLEKAVAYYQQSADWAKNLKQ